MENVGGLLLIAVVMADVAALLRRHSAFTSNDIRCFDAVQIR